MGKYPIQKLVKRVCMSLFFCLSFVLLQGYTYTFMKLLYFHKWCPYTDNNYQMTKSTNKMLHHNSCNQKCTRPVYSFEQNQNDHPFTVFFYAKELPGSDLEIEISFEEIIYLYSITSYYYLIEVLNIY